MANGEEAWVEKGEGYPEFKREDVVILRYRVSLD
jgi:hypothetical protein